MRFTCDRSALVDKLGVLARGVSTRSALPVLSGILLQARDGRLDLFSTDMELSIKASLATTVEREGEIVVPARLFTDVVTQPARRRGASSRPARRRSRSAPAGAAFSLNSWAASDFPQTSTFDMSERLRGRPRAVRRDARTRWAARLRATRRGRSSPACSSPSGATRSRWSPPTATGWPSKRRKLDHSLDDEVQAIVPVKALERGARAWLPALGDGDSTARHRREPGVFKLSDPAGDVWIASRLIDGQFPNYSQLLPDTLRPRGHHRPRRSSWPPRGASACWRRRTRRCACVQRGQAHDEGAHPGRRPGRRDARRGVLRRAVRDRLQPRGISSRASTPSTTPRPLRFTNPLRPGLVSGPADDFTYLIMPIRLSS